MPAERFVAGHLLTAARTPEDLGRIQRATLVPLELALSERSKTERLTPGAGARCGCRGAGQLPLRPLTPGLGATSSEPVRDVDPRSFAVGMGLELAVGMGLDEGPVDG